MKLSAKEKAKIKRDRKLDAMIHADKVGISRSMVLHPIRHTESQAHKYSQQTKQNLDSIVHPDQEDDWVAIKQGVNQIHHMSGFKKTALYTITTILLVSIIWGFVV